MCWQNYQARHVVKLIGAVKWVVSSLIAQDIYIMLQYQM
jgi:hypothetical protein